MKQQAKRMLSVLLALVLLLCCTAVAFAQAPEEKTPIVLIPGFGQSETKVYDGDRILMTKYADRGISFYALVFHDLHFS